MKHNAYSQDSEWLSRCEDFEQSVQKYKSVRFSHFVSPHELAVFSTHYRLSRDVSFMAWGGSEDAERVILGFFPDFLTPDTQDFPITPLKISNVGGLNHRDVLGSVLGLGIKREMVGDIYFDKDTAVIMCENTAKDYILYNLKTVGRKNVEVTEIDAGNFSLKHSFKMSTVIVASLRLDAVVAAVAPMSRQDASRVISQDFVNVNFTLANSPDKKLSEGDVISVRHHGRFVIESIAGETRKGRTVLEIKKYI
ncbi:MAG: hypothetical protein IJC10_02650 [Clostridia bacterium]|nr:hypothetical protein [Clostridia bacterium]